MLATIYAILTKMNHRSYIGSTSNFSRRQRKHLTTLRAGHHCNPGLQRTWDKYGSGDLFFQVLQELEADEIEVLKAEQHWIDLLKPDFNIAMVAGTRRGVPQTLEARRKISLAQIGRKMPPRTEEQRQAISQRNKGYRHTDEAKAKIRQAVQLRQREQGRFL